MYISKDSKVVVQGITGNQGQYHTRLMLDYGTQIVAGTSPNKGGSQVLDIPVFNTVQEAVDVKDADTSIVFVPAQFAYNAVLESLNAGIQLTCIITEFIPILDMVRLTEKANELGLHVVGPNCPGLMVPGEIKLGIMPGDMCNFGDIGLVSKSGTLSYEVANALCKAGFGLCDFIGIGGDPVRGTGMVEAVEYLENDNRTKSIVIIGEIGGDEEEKTAKMIAETGTKPVIAFIAGKSAPEGKRMGHAGAIISGNAGTAQGKIAALENAGAKIAISPFDIPYLIESIDKNK
jgi:succinyl-CoA synthetase alpha subunit